MSAFNIVKFKVKPGQDEAFLNAHRNGKARWPGLSRGTIVKTGDGTYCLIGEWPDKATRDEGMKRVMDDPRMGPDNPMPFDGKRMIFGGFAPVVDLAA